MTTASICPRAHGEGGLGRPQRSWGALWTCAVNGRDLTQHTLATTADLGSAASLDAGTEPGNVVQLGASGRLSAPLGAVAPGTVLAFAGETPPEGYLECDGASVSRTAYAELFEAIGTAFGAGDGSTTFGLPDVRGVFLRGWDNGRGADAGRILGSLQQDAFQGHWHQSYGNLNYGVANQITAHTTNSGGSAGTVNTSVRAAIADGTNGTPRMAAETRPRNVAFMHIIKY